MADKRRERALVETARKLYPWFPPGELVDFEKPDVLLVDGDTRIGIEVTELFQPPKHGSRFGPHVIAKFHQRVMQIADRRAQSLRPLDVLVYFNYRDDLRDAESCAQELIEFAQSHPCGTHGMLDGIPYGFSVVRIAEPYANEIPRWRCLDTGETLKASRERIAAVIADKNKLVVSYRLKVPRVWLLIACSFADFANNFYVPRRYRLVAIRVRLRQGAAAVVGERRLQFAAGRRRRLKRGAAGCVHAETANRTSRSANR